MNSLIAATILSLIQGSAAEDVDLFKSVKAKADTPDSLKVAYQNFVKTTKKDKLKASDIEPLLLPFGGIEVTENQRNYTTRRNGKDITGSSLANAPMNRRSNRESRAFRPFYGEHCPRWSQ